MSTTSGNRVLRSASKARSDGGAGPGPSAAVAVSTRGRGRGSRRGASPAAAADPPENDDLKVNTTSKEAYGTIGRPGELQQESTRLGMGQAVNPILQAVSGAEASNDQVAQGKLGRLAAVDEEEESSGISWGESHNTSRPQIPQFVQPTPRHSLLSSLQFWAPHQPQQASSVEYAVQNEGIWENAEGPWGKLNISHDRHWTERFIWHFVLLTALVAWAIYQAPSIGNAYVSAVGAGSATLSKGTYVTNYDYNMLKRRVDRVEHHLLNLPLHTSSTGPTQINWFTPGFDALIDVQLSSPTATICDSTWKPWPFSIFLEQSCPELPVSPPQMMALQTWDDPMYDRWCSPRSGGSLQLTVQVARNIMPTELVVEYMSKESSPTGYMDSAPKEVELWIEVEDDDIRAKFSDAIGRMYPELWEDSSPQGRELHLSRNLGPDWVPIGRWMYNVYEQPNVQGFKITPPLLEYDVDTSKVAVRVNSNWGNVGYTCINRFSLYGVDTSGVKDNLEEDPKLIKG